MPFIIREHPTHLTPINGVAFAVHEAGSISDEVGDELAELFLSVPLFRLAEEDELPEGFKPAPVKVPEPPKETAAQKKERLKNEKTAQAAQEVIDKAVQEAADKAAGGSASTEQVEGATAGEGAENTAGEQDGAGAPATESTETTEAGETGDGTPATDKPAEDNVF